MSKSKNSNLYREYIGAVANGVTFTDVNINSAVDFHFIIAYAIDYTKPPAPRPTNGDFRIFWDSNSLTPAAVADIKRSYNNVKVSLSLGGETINGTVAVQFAATNVDMWIRNAVSSLTDIIREYHLDGIDIDYQSIDPDSETIFLDCIGKLVTTLKTNKVVSFVSIAPHENPLLPKVQHLYTKLWHDYKSFIDCVNFKFYKYPKMEVAEFLHKYEQQLANYYGGNVLASFQTDGSGGLSPADGFFRACTKLQDQGKLPGIFASSANIGNADRLDYEWEAQSLLAKAQ